MKSIGGREAPPGSAGTLLLWCLAAAGSGVLWGLCFAREPHSLAAWIVLAPLPLLLSHRRAGWLAFLHGYAGWMTGLGWIVPTLTTYGAAISWPLAVLLTSLLAAFLALFHAVFGWLGGPLWRRLGLAGRLLGLPALWVTLEWVRTYLFGGFPWNLAAYAWVGVPGALPLAAWIGSYGLSFLVLWVAVAEASALERLGRQAKEQSPARPPAEEGGEPRGGHRLPGGRPVAAWGTMAGALMLPLLLLPMAGRWSLRLSEGELLEARLLGLPFSLVQPNIPDLVDPDPATVLRNFARVEALSLPACEPGSLVVWPESAEWPFVYGRDEILDQALRRLTSRGCTVLFNSAVPALSPLPPAPANAAPAGRTGPGDARAAAGGAEELYYNSAILLAPGEPPVRYDKRHLVPFGEYVPFGPLFSPFMRKLGRGLGGYLPAEKVTLLPWHREKLGAAICYEVIFPAETAELSRAGATILATVTNDAWYGDTAAPWQHFRAVRFRAAENRRPFLRAAITGVSAFVAPDGAVVSQLGVGKEGVIRGVVAGETQITPYARAPWLPPALATAVAAIAVYFSRRRSPP